jgi:hypothetical protein
MSPAVLSGLLGDGITDTEAAGPAARKCRTPVMWWSGRPYRRRSAPEKKSLDGAGQVEYV